ncbi:hypothetical protein E2562_030633 [Oryza meyeriana var. granulata]|uniref:DUF834 domain-containing protein n=1 Tax=Oryza meyeriana var. granulata TaxID=110450 RepID=A0A6G1CI67_9ORYZ|nr:hypothetical protein E2562_030633 [Oryza meyeriana var. granulata]
MLTGERRDDGDGARWLGETALGDSATGRAALGRQRSGRGRWRSGRGRWLTGDGSAHGQGRRRLTGGGADVWRTRGGGGAGKKKVQGRRRFLFIGREGGKSRAATAQDWAEEAGFAAAHGRRGRAGVQQRLDWAGWRRARADGGAAWAEERRKQGLGRAGEMAQAGAGGWLNF